ncbi:MAG: holo-ACP synthase [Burkholderiales bacterium]|nr:holo-ACP synthase [Burkholderiales bacterium]
MNSIYGIGTDICEIGRIRSAWQRHGQRFAERILGQQELEVFRQRHARAPARGERYLATRFAAKEAFSKAIGLGIHMPMTWRACEILNAAGGRPNIVLHGELAAWCAARQLRFHVSVSDEVLTAMAFVVAEVSPRN